jgi:hypothetical protein
MVAAIAKAFKRASGAAARCSHSYHGSPDCCNTGNPTSQASKVTLNVDKALPPPARKRVRNG